MLDKTEETAPPPGSHPVRRIFAEAVLVAVVGVGLALLGNRISPQGLQLARNYFPGDSSPVVPAPASVTTGNGVSSNTSVATTNAVTSELETKLRAEGLHLLDRAGAEKLFRDPRLQENAILFIDARGEDDYAKGHIPGAFEFTPYHPEKYFATVLPACQVARQIVVYCTGGECEDSHSTALILRDAGVPAEKLFVFGGGMTEWESAKLPVESGARNSGDIHPPSP